MEFQHSDGMSADDGHHIIFDHENNGDLLGAQQHMMMPASNQFDDMALDGGHKLPDPGLTTYSHGFLNDNGLDMAHHHVGYMEPRQDHMQSRQDHMQQQGLRIPQNHNQNQFPSFPRPFQSQAYGNVMDGQVRPQNDRFQQATGYVQQGHPGMPPGIATQGQPMYHNIPGNQSFMQPPASIDMIRQLQQKVLQQQNQLSVIRSRGPAFYPPSNNGNGTSQNDISHGSTTSGLGMTQQSTYGSHMVPPPPQQRPSQQHPPHYLNMQTHPSTMNTGISYRPEHTSFPAFPDQHPRYPPQRSTIDHNQYGNLAPPLSSNQDSSMLRYGAQNANLPAFPDQGRPTPPYPELARSQFAIPAPPTTGPSYRQPHWNGLANANGDDASFPWMSQAAPPPLSYDDLSSVPPVIEEETSNNRRSSRIKRAGRPPGSRLSRESSEPSPSPALRKERKSTQGQDENDDVFEDAIPSLTGVGGGGMNKVSYVELILAIEKKRKSEWASILVTMNTSKVRNGSRLQDEALGLSLPEALVEEMALARRVRAEEKARIARESKANLAASAASLAAQSVAEAIPPTQSDAQQSHDVPNGVNGLGDGQVEQQSLEIQPGEGVTEEPSTITPERTNVSAPVTGGEEATSQHVTGIAEDGDVESTSLGKDEEILDDREDAVGELNLESREQSPVPSELGAEISMTRTVSLALESHAGSSEDDDPIEERMLIKWRDASYIHASWETEIDLITRLSPEFAGGRLDSRLKRARVQPRSPYIDQGGFNPDFRRVERVLELGDDSVLIKWSILGYDEATWETREDLIACKVEFEADIARYHKREEAAVALAAVPLSERRRRLFTREVLPQLSESPEFKNGLKLRPYQVEALNWLCFNWCQDRNSILADEMGLGKTAQSISFAQVVGKNRGPVLVVAPLATLGHWQRELERWTDLNVVIFRGSVQSRGMCKEREFFVGPQHDWYKFDIIVTNFETVLQEETALTKCPYSLLIVDEAHRLKNRKSKLTMLLRDRLEYAACLLLTGTPIQNDTTELWTLLNFVDRQTFKSLDEFQEKFGSVTTAKDMDDFHATLKPYLLRRFKADVEASLPTKEEVIIEVELTELQKYYYRSVYEQNVQTLLRGVIPGTRLNLNNVAIQLRKCCNHPYLIEGVEAKAVQDATIGEITDGTKLPHDRVMQLLVQASGKTILLDKLLPKLYQQKHRVLIFSQFVRLLDILEDYMRFREYGYERIDGSVSGARRQEAIDRFSAPDSASFVFLLSTRGCGQGINLTSADTVIMFDSDWNPQNDVQAQARCHRIGQTKPVVVYRLITRKTYEQEMFSRASKKLGLDEAVNSKLMQSISEDGGTANEDEAKLFVGVSDQELEHMLKFGAYALKDPNEADASRAFCEADIDDILNTRATRIVQPREASGGRATERFSKATFVSRTSGEVDVEDPEFWSKVLGKDVALAVDADDDEPSFGKGRRRRRGAFGYSEEVTSTTPLVTRPSSASQARNLDDEDSVASDSESVGGVDKAIISKAAMKGLSQALIMFGPEKGEELAKRNSMNEVNSAKYALGMALVAVVWCAKLAEDPSPPFPGPENDDHDAVNVAIASCVDWLKTGDNVQEYSSGPVRKSLLVRLKKVLEDGKEYDTTKEMVVYPRLKDRCRDVTETLADIVDVENFLSSPKQRPMPVLRGVPPCEGWRKVDDRSLLRACELYGFQRKRKPEVWREIMADERLKWTVHWYVEKEGETPTAKQKEVRVHLKRLTSRFIRIVGIIANQGDEPLEETVVQPKPAKPAKEDVDAIEQGELTQLWTNAELERLSRLLLRWGSPKDSFTLNISVATLGGGYPSVESQFAAKFPRKTAEDIKMKSEEMISEASAEEIRPGAPGKRRIWNRVELLRELWETLSQFESDDSFLELLGFYFKGLHKIQRQMPRWWTPKHDVGLLRTVCKYGLDTWNQAFGDSELFLAPPPNSDPIPSIQDLHRRVVAMFDWLSSIAKRQLPPDADKDESREKGTELIKPAQTEEMLNQISRRHDAIVDEKEKVAAKERAIEEKKRRRAENKAAKEAKRAQKISEKKAKKAAEKAAKKQAKKEAKAAARAASGLDISESGAKRVKVAKGEKENVDESGAIIKKKRGRKPKKPAAGEDEEQVPSGGINPSVHMLLPPPPPPPPIPAVTGSGKRGRKRRKPKSDDELEESEEEKYIPVPSASRRRRGGKDQDAPAPPPPPPPPPPQITRKPAATSASGRKRSKRGAVTPVEDDGSLPIDGAVPLSSGTTQQQQQQSDAGTAGLVFGGSLMGQQSMFLPQTAQRLNLGGGLDLMSFPPMLNPQQLQNFLQMQGAFQPSPPK